MSRELTPEEQKEVADKITAILEEYDCDMTVSSTIHILKRDGDNTNNTNGEEEKTNSTSEEGSESSSGEPSI